MSKVRSFCPIRRKRTQKTDRQRVHYRAVSGDGRVPQLLILLIDAQHVALFCEQFRSNNATWETQTNKKTPLRIVIRVPLFATFLSTPHPMPHGRDCALKKILASLCAKFLRSFVIEFPIQFTFGMDTTTGHWWPCVCGNAFNEIKRQ